MTLDIGTRLDGSAFALPIDAASSRIVMVGKSGSGKTNASAVLIEEVLKAGVAPIVLDPLGNLWGLRSSADGNGAGIPIAIFGGLRADAPLPLDRAEYLADYLAEGVPAVLDLSEMATEDQVRFADVFLPRLLQQAAIHRRNLFVVLEEADRFAKNTGKTTPVTMFARAARNAGIGWMYSTHKPAIVHKEILDTANLFVAMKMTGELAQDALAGEIGSRIGRKTANRMVEDFAGFGRGDAWFIPDGDWLADDVEWEPERIHFRKRATFHVQPPRVGVERSEPKVLAAVDIEALRQALAIAPPAPPENVDALKARIAELEAKLLVPEVSVERVEVSVLNLDDLERLDTTLESMRAFGAELVRLAGRIYAQIEAHLRIDASSPSISENFRNDAETRVPGNVESRSPAVRPETRNPEAARGLSKGGFGLAKVLVDRYPMKMTRAQLATLAGRSIKSSSFPEHIKEIAALGLASTDSNLLYASRAALDRFGGPDPKASSPDQVLQLWRSALKTPGLVAMLDAAVAAYPRALTMAEWATAAGLSPTSSAIGANAKILRDNGLFRRSAGNGHFASDLLVTKGKK